MRRCDCWNNEGQTGLDPILAAGALSTYEVRTAGRRCRTATRATAIAEEKKQVQVRQLLEGRLPCSPFSAWTNRILLKKASMVVLHNI